MKKMLSILLFLRLLLLVSPVVVAMPQLLRKMIRRLQLLLPQQAAKMHLKMQLKKRQRSSLSCFNSRVDWLTSNRPFFICIQRNSGRAK